MTRIREEDSDNSTELNSGLKARCRSWRHTQKHDWLASRWLAVRCSTGSVELSWVVSLWTPLNVQLLPVSRSWSLQANPTARHSVNTARPRIRVGVSRDMPVYFASLRRVLIQPGQAQSGWVGLGVPSFAPRCFTRPKMVIHLGTNRL